MRWTTYRGLKKSSSACGAYACVYDRYKLNEISYLVTEGTSGSSQNRFKSLSLIASQTTQKSQALDKPGFVLLRKDLLFEFAYFFTSYTCKVFTRISRS